MTRDGSDDDDFDVDVDDNADDDTEYVAPTQDEWERVQRALSRAKKEARERRLKLKELTAKGGDGDGNNAVDAERIRMDAQEAEEAKWKRRTVIQAAASRLAQAGLVGDPSRLANLVDAEQVNIAEDGEIDGLDDQIEDIKDDYPSLFRDAGVGTRTTRVDAADKGRRQARERPMSSAERIQAQAMRRTARR